MDNPVLITHPGQLQAWANPALSWPYDPDDLVRHAADAHWICLDAAGEPAARCSLWWRRPAAYGNHRVGFIGHYAAAGSEPALRILAHACKQLRQAGCTLAVGPLDGSTWRRYRFVTEGSERPAFLLEPVNPPAWPTHWSAAGFDLVAEYLSSLNSDLGYEDPRGREAGQALQRAGVRLRSLDLARFEQELARLYPLIVRCFKGSFLHAPISEAEFMAQNQALRPYLKPELVIIAEHENRPVGLLLAFPDALQAACGEAIDTVVLKTLVIGPERAYAGLGSYLAAEIHHRCRDLGYREVIHALMHRSNKSRNISARYGGILRRYGLFAKAL